jgi:nicotinate-nucleotide--dimethylbenzimidazole phosphoribosyltransferase
LLAHRWPEVNSLVPVSDASWAALCAREPSTHAALIRLDAWPVAVLAGLLLACAAYSLPVLLDGAVTAAAAMVASELAPAASGTWLASQRGTAAAMAEVWSRLGLRPFVEAGIGTGEGAGATMLLAMVPAAAVRL